MIYPPRELSISNDFIELATVNKCQEQRRMITYQSKKTPALEVMVSYSRAIGLPRRVTLPVANNELQDQLDENCEEVPWCIQARHLPEEVCEWAHELLGEGFIVAGIISPTEKMRAIGFQMVRGEKVKGAHTAYLFVWKPDCQTMQDLALKWAKEGYIPVVQDATESDVPLSNNN